MDKQPTLMTRLLDCGCRADVTVNPIGEYGALGIRHCPLHKAAPALLAALKAAATELEEIHLDHTRAESADVAARVARAAIKAARE
jgi:hypothetical protein